MNISENDKIKYFKKIKENIKKNGFHTTSIIEEINCTPFTYSTGIFENYNIPEIFISGLGPNLSTELVEKYVEKYKFEKVSLNTKIEDLTQRFPVYFIESNLEDLSEYVLTSKKYYENQEYKYVQLIFPDLNLLFPNETGYDYDQQIFGTLEL